MLQVKLSLFTNDMILYVITQRIHKKLSVLINELSKIIGYNNTQESVVFLYTNNEQSIKEIQKATAFHIPSKTINWELV